MFKIVKYVIIDILRSKIVMAYTIFLLLLSLSIFNLEDNSTKGLLGLLNIILIVVPLVSIVFATIYMYNSAEFIELMLSQPIKRSKIWLSLFAGLAFAMVLAYLIGIGIPVIIYQFSITGYMLVATGILLTVIFVSIALLASVYTRDKAKGIGTAILLWLYFSLLFDGLVLFVLFQFADYPLEKVMIGLSFANPIDLSRILILLQMDVSALMGYTGAVFKSTLGEQWGMVLSFIILFIWIYFPIWLSLKKFQKKDL